MAIDAPFARVFHGRRVGISVIDALLRALRTSGQFPAPRGPLELRLTGQTAPVARRFDPPRILHTTSNGHSFLTTDGSWSTPGSSDWFPLGAGFYSAEITGAFYRALPFTLEWPVDQGNQRIVVEPANPPGTARLLPGPAYALPDVTTSRFQLGPTLIRGCLLQEDGRPIDSVKVEVSLGFLNPPELPALGDWPFSKTETNAAGDWVLILPGRRYYHAAPETLPVTNPPSAALTDTITISFSPPNPPLKVNMKITLGGENSLRNTALCGQVVGAGGRPIAGATISTGLNARRSVSRANGAWSLYFALDQPAAPAVSVTATLPGGATSSAVVGVDAHATNFVPTFQFP